MRYFFGERAGVAISAHDIDTIDDSLNSLNHEKTFQFYSGCDETVNLGIISYHLLSYYNL